MNAERTLTVECSVCHKAKMRIARKSPRQDRVLFYSTSGARWGSSTMCPECLALRAKALAASKVVQDECFVEPALYYSTKGCDRCDGKLELSRYKTCTTCKPELGDDEGTLDASFTAEDTTARVSNSNQWNRNFKISELPLLDGEFMRKR